LKDEKGENWRDWGAGDYRAQGLTNLKHWNADIYLVSELGVTLMLAVHGHNLNS
jgi:hypothetical protein